MTENGYVTRVVTIEILEDLLRHCQKHGIGLPVIVFADGFKGHYGIEIAEFCEKNKIKMIFLKPNTTHACQPLDVTCFSPLKSMIKKLSQNWHGKPENSNRKLDKHSLMKEVTWEAIEKVFSNPKLVPSGFRRSGLLPFGPENMDWDKFSSSKIFERRPDENTMIENVVEGCSSISIGPVSNNNNITSLAPEYCGNAEDVADPAFCSNPLSVAEDNVSSGQVVTTDPLLSQHLPLPGLCEAPTVPNTPHVTPQSSVSGPPPPANNDTDPLIEPLLALPVSAAYSAQASSAPVFAPPLSLPTTGHQTLSTSTPSSSTRPAASSTACSTTSSASAPATTTTSDVITSEELAKKLVTKQKGLSHDKKMRQLQRYEHLIDPDGDKIVEFQNLYKAAKFDVANTEFQVWLLYKQQAAGTEAEAFERILFNKIPKNVPLRKRKRKDHLPPGKDRHDLTSPPMMQALREMEDRAENKSSKKLRTSKRPGNQVLCRREWPESEERPVGVRGLSVGLVPDQSELEFSDGIRQSETGRQRGRRQRHQQLGLSGDGGGFTLGQHQPRILQEDVSRGRGAGGGGARGVHEVAALPDQAEPEPDSQQAVLHVLQQVREVHRENKSSKKLRTSKPATITSSSTNDTNGNLKAKVQEESIQEKVIETPSEPLQEMDVNKSTEVPATTEKVTKKSCSKTSKRGAKESSVGDSMKAAFCDEISSPTQTSSVQAPPVQVEVSTNVLPLDVPTKSKKRRKKKDDAVATRIMTRKTRKAFLDL